MRLTVKEQCEASFWICQRTLAALAAFFKTQDSTKEQVKDLSGTLGCFSILKEPVQVRTVEDSRKEQVETRSA